MENTECAQLNGEDFFVFRNDKGVSETIRNFGTYAFEETIFYDGILAEGDCFFDVGSNIGAVSFGLKQRKKSLVVVGFEANVQSYRLSCVNLFKFDNVNLFNLAVGEREGLVATSDIPTGEVANYGRKNIHIHGGRKYIKVACARLDEFVALNGHPPRLIKIDVENSTFEAFKGCEGLFGKGAIFSIEADRKTIAKDVIHFAGERGGRIFHKSFINVMREGFSPDLPGYWNVHPHLFVCFGDDDPGLFDEASEVRGLEAYLKRLPFEIDD